MAFVRGIFDLFNRGDLDEVLELLAVDAEMDWSRAIGPYRGVYRADRARTLVTDYTDSFESVRLETHELIDAGEQVVVFLTFHVRGRDGVEAAADSIQVWTLRDGQVARVCMYQEREEALGAAGIRPDHLPGGEGAPLRGVLRRG